MDNCDDDGCWPGLHLLFLRHWFRLVDIVTSDMWRMEWGGVVDGIDILDIIRGTDLIRVVWSNEAIRTWPIPNPKQWLLSCQVMCAGDLQFVPNIIKRGNELINHLGCVKGRGGEAKAFSPARDSWIVDWLDIN